jgi:hypothetical protein
MEDVTQDTSNINPLALLLLVAMSVVVLTGSRQAAVKALLGIAAFLPLGQQIVLWGLNLHFFRILILVGLCRLVVRGESQTFKLNGLDKLFIWWALVGALCGALRDPASILGVNCLGGAFNALGTYFLIRILIKDPYEVLGHIRFLALAAIIVALAMAWEYATHRNLFAVFGGVPAEVLERSGRFRCQGPFRHPILAGTFAATLFPLLVALAFRGGRDRPLAIVGSAACAFSTYAAASSGALLSGLIAVVGLGLWGMRTRMRLIRTGIVSAIIVMALMMNAPVWYVIARLSSLVGGTGWHRAYLIDQAVKYFGEWWLIGTSVTAHWAPAGQVLAVDPKNMDITNHYVAQGIQGGVLRLGLFLALIVACFKTIGRAVQARSGLPLDRKLLWAFGVSLAGHCTAFISISYFDQIEVFWFWLIAVIASLAGWVRRGALSAQARKPVESRTTVSASTAFAR